MISELDIEEVLDRANHSHLINDVSIHLGLSQTEIDNTTNGFCGLRIQARRVLHLWRDKNDDVATREVLLQQMQKVDSCKKDAGDLRKEWGNLK